MDIRKATQAYEKWLAERMPLIDADLRLKHQRMTEGAFPFLRATFYRWVQSWPQICPQLALAPSVLSVGDLHVENFGTWRDSEGRLIWGINDFDEAYSIPYPNDLVRLAVSAALAAHENRLRCELAEICDAVLTGYQDALQRGGMPLVLSEQHRWLRDLAISDLRDPVQYWARLDKLPTVPESIPSAIRGALKQALPERQLPYRLVHRQAGLGSLGRRRLTALAEWRGGKIAREAKELTISAWRWEASGRMDKQLFYQKAMERAVRAPDPIVWTKDRWLIRRLAPDCSRIDLSSLPRIRDELRLLRAMGWETGNIHLSTKGAARKILADLKSRPAQWLRQTVRAMAEATLKDWKDWARNAK
jgi:hypothetical protein